MRDALEAFIEAPMKSLTTAAGHFGGCIGGLRDLSTLRRCMFGYGR
jgi:hypothetical protein